mgnify:CR=1 FL=1
MKVNIVTQEGKDSGRTATLNKDVYGITPSEHAMYLDVKQYLANQRQGTSKSKERGEIARTTKKLYKQKGTGGARHGSMRSPLFRGGGTIFGPRPRSYSFKLNKKLKVLARRSALSTMAADAHIIVMDKFSMDTPNTQGYGQVLNALGLEGKKSMVVLADQDKAVYLSSRNFEDSKVVTVSELSTYAILNAGTLILTEAAIDKIENSLITK